MKITLATALTVVALGLTAQPAAAMPEPQPPVQLLAAYQTATCGTVISADTTVANQLNGTLQNKMRGYMSAYRVSCARAVVNAVQARGLDQRAAVIAIATVIVETSLQNISEEVDHDSLGLFQQRASWGTAAQRLNPAWATNAFLDKMVRLYPNNSWRTAPVGEVAQAVQVSAYPDRYQVEANDAQKIVNALSGPSGQASVYGVLSDGRLTYTAIDAATNRRTHGAVTSTAALGFTPKAMATLNFNTILITDTSGKLYRVDVITNSNSLVFNPPVLLASSGWTHDLLAFDGGRLFGIADGSLRRYVINAAKPAIGNITSNTFIGSGFTLKTLTATAPHWILGTTTGGQLISYKINGAGACDRHELRSTTWQVFDHLLSPGGGYYLGHHRDGSMIAYSDANPTDGNGSDLTGRPAVDTGGWTQPLLSAWPGTVT
ncbi:hypothetical protein [Herbidospora sp. RD11066]